MAEQTSKADRVKLNRELAQMLKGGVIMDVTTPEQARIAEEAGACAVMALERIPADIRAAGGVSRMSDPKMIKGIQEHLFSVLRKQKAAILSTPIQFQRDGNLDEAMQELVEPIGLQAAGMGEGIGAGQLVGTRQLLAHAGPMALIDGTRHFDRLVLQYQGSYTGHRRQVIVAPGFGDIG